MTDQLRAGVVASTIVLTFAAAAATWGQPAPGARGCCCVGYGGSYACAEKSQADCLAAQPAAPKFTKLADWKKAVDASKAQEAKPLLGGWIAESCEKAEDRIGCCCFPTGADRPDCKAGMSEFDCKAQCAQLRDGRLPSGCTWAVGTCQP
jgi:hypothetical protein